MLRFARTAAALLLAAAPAAAAPEAPAWPDAMRAAQLRLKARAPAAQAWAELEKAYPAESDWLAQDLRGLSPDVLLHEGSISTQLMARVLEEAGPAAASLQAELAGAPQAADHPLDLYARACRARRAARLRNLKASCPEIVFAKHYVMGGSHYAYTEGLSDAQDERTFIPGASLCVLSVTGDVPVVRTLLDDPHGVIRDPDVSYDGRRILFAWKKSDRQDDYHLYEMEAASGAVRPITGGAGFADYEGAYLPNGDILFNSTRCVQTVDCWWTEVSNLYTCDGDGRYLRRLAFDQVHDNYPTVHPDGRVIYTRWEYNDRGQLYVQPLFQMYPDGTGQTEFYGNNSWFPTTLAHARGIPGSGKVVAIAAGHHTRQVGKLVLVDPSRGRQENAGVQLIAPVRDTPAVRMDKYGQDGELFQYPYPLSEREFLVAFAPRGGAQPRFGIYWMDCDGRRELLAADARVACGQPVPLAPRPRPTLRPSSVDYRKATGTYFLQDIYAGPGLAGIARGTVRKLRVVALEYRAAGIGSNRNKGPAGRALVSTPVAIDNGTWDVKRVLGESPVHEDGSSFFTVPARTPVYFQAVDTNGYVVQTMRSWSTLQPGETFTCVGCHEPKNAAPPAASGVAQALAAGPQPLAPFHGPPRGFSFTAEVQPILDRHCIRCHSSRPEADTSRGKAPFSLLGAPKVDRAAKRAWSESYLALTQSGCVTWLNAQSIPPMLPPYSAGAARSRLMTLLGQPHQDVRLSRQELETIACWIDLLVPFCGDYTEAAAWSAKDTQAYRRLLDKRARMQAEEQKNIEAFVLRQSKAGN